MKCRKRYAQKEINEQGIRSFKAKQRWIKKTKGAPTEDVLKAYDAWVRAKRKYELMQHCKL